MVTCWKHKKTACLLQDTGNIWHFYFNDTPVSFKIQLWMQNMSSVVFVALIKAASLKHCK